jgi:hypothetical protein
MLINFSNFAPSIINIKLTLEVLKLNLESQLSKYLFDCICFRIKVYSYKTWFIINPNRLADRNWEISIWFSMNCKYLLLAIAYMYTFDWMRIRVIKTNGVYFIIFIEKDPKA